MMYEKRLGRISNQSAPFGRQISLTPKLKGERSKGWAGGMIGKHRSGIARPLQSLHLTFGLVEGLKRGSEFSPARAEGWRG